MSRTSLARARGLFPALVPAVAAAVTLGAGSTARVDSVWSAASPAVDGALADWSGTFTRLGDSPVSIAFQNEGESLYVALVSSDPGMRMLLALGGFTIYWDPKGGERKAGGLRVPPVASLEGRGSRGGGDRPERAGTPGSQPALPPVAPVSFVETIGSGKDDRHRYELAYTRTIGIDAQNGVHEGALVYELKIPLARSEAHPIAIGTVAGKVIGVRIETGEIPRPQGGGEGSRGSGWSLPGGGTGGRGGMGGGGYGGRGEVSGMTEAKPVKIWNVVRLAAPPA